MSATRPAISVIIPLFNKSAYILRAVQSALMQQPAPAEVLVVDDGSTDDGPALLAALPPKPLLRVVRQPNAGEGAARNRGLSEMRGDLAAFLDADDEWSPGHLRNLLELASAFPRAGLFATGYRSVYRRGVCVDTAVAAAGPALLADYFATARGGYCLHISSCAVWKNVAVEVGGFPSGEPLGADLAFFAGVALRRAVALHPSVSGMYYASLSGSALHTHPWAPVAPAALRVIRHAERAGAAIPESAREYAGWLLAEHALTGISCGRRREARALLRSVDLPAPPLLRLAVNLLPDFCLRPLLRMRRSRFAVGNRQQVTNRVVYSHV